ncbi:zinc finger protein 789-like isoform X2 [Alligator mississippiensis]|uniref:zinc finger protein 789-like isoform X2 n=1 Tax=Alligator mississippiensis TaxID=8496 RepID=UPI002877FD55|nr:zinc finger protein 789-like isoform X2 [Alligator mississippiensis]
MSKLQLPEAAEDISVYFTREEWELLEDEDKELYQDQMLRNYQVLVSLGYRGPTPDLICCIQQGETKLWVDDNEEGGESWLSEDVSPGTLLLQFERRRGIKAAFNEYLWLYEMPLGAVGIRKLSCLGGYEHLLAPSRIAYGLLRNQGTRNTSCETMSRVHLESDPLFSWGASTHAL